MNPTEKCPLCGGEGFDSGGVEFNGLPTPPLPCILCIEREARQKAESENQKLRELLEELINGSTRMTKEIIDEYNQLTK